MPAFESLGPSVPAALSYLIADRILPPNPPGDAYKWTTKYYDDAEHELLTTARKAVWSRGGIIQRVLDFEHEGQDIRHALFAEFPLTQSAGRTATPKSKALAAVVFLTTTAHVYYCDGPSYVVALSFEIDCAFACAHGLVIQRKVTQAPALAPTPTPVIPQVPANSFRTSQGHASFKSSFRASFQPRPSRLSLGSRNAPATVQPFADFVVDPLLNERQYEGPRHFLLTDPLAEVTTITEALGPSSTVPDLDVLDTDESILYTSPPSPTDHLTILVTFNQTLNRYAVWHAIFTNQQALRQPPSPSKSDTARPKVKKDRRSSFNPRASTGTITPVVHPRDVSGSVAPRKPSARHSEVFDPDATELDEDFFVKHDPELDALHVSKSRDANRRTSSMVARAELSAQGSSNLNQPTAAGTSFKAGHRLSQSFGPPRDRTSFGRYPHQRLSGRASVTGSMSVLSDLDEVSSQSHTIRSVAEQLLSSLESTKATLLKGALPGVLRDTMVLIRVGAIPVSDGPLERSIPWPTENQRIFESRCVHDNKLTRSDVELYVVSLNCVHKVNIPLQETTVAPPARYTPSTPIQVALQTDVLDVAPIETVSGQLLAAVVRRDERNDLVISQYTPRHKGPLLTVPIGALVSDDLTSARFTRGSPCHGKMRMTTASGDASWAIGLRPREELIETLLSFCEDVISTYFTTESLLGSLFATLQSFVAQDQSVSELHLLAVCMVFMVSDDPVQLLQDFPIEQGHISRQPLAWSWTLARRHDSFAATCLTLAAQAAPALKELTQNLYHEQRHMLCIALMLCLHFLGEESKLSTLVDNHTAALLLQLDAVKSLLARLLGWEGWATSPTVQGLPAIFHPLTVREPTVPSIQEFLKSVWDKNDSTDFAAIKDIAQALDILPIDFDDRRELEQHYTPRIQSLRSLKERLKMTHLGDGMLIELLQDTILQDISLDTLPESISATLHHQVELARVQPPTSWSSELLDTVDRQDVSLLLRGQKAIDPSERRTKPSVLTSDVHSICVSSTTSKDVKTHHMTGDLTRHVFRDDKRFEEAVKLLDPLRPAVAELFPYAGMTEAKFLDLQKAVAQDVYVRTMSLPAGQALLAASSRRPMPTERIAIPSFNATCNFQPSNNIVSVDRSEFTEEKVCWAFFHAGVNAGLQLAEDTEGIDTSWYVLNKPTELGNRHAGLLFALGLRGHLKAMAKWLAFKYLTPKHTMTSISLLIGLSASYLGTMDAWVTRVLSVHVTRLLPPGAAELNLTSLTQAAGMMGVGLLYYKTQHRRMSEVLLSEIEHIEDEEDALGRTANLRGESYRLCAGLGLGFVNLGCGSNLTTLQDMNVSERLMAVATGPRDVSAVHLLDQAVAGATLAIALIYMKTNDKSVARRIDVPSSTKQFDYIRPDMLLLRTIAKHLVLWDAVKPSLEWVHDNTPADWSEASAMATMKKFVSTSPLSSRNMPFYNIIAGLCFAMALRFAGSGSREARSVLLFYFDTLDRASTISDASYTFDATMTQNTISRVLGVLGVSMSIVMSGTGDLETFRRLRSLHSRTEERHAYGLHQATHMAIGALFLGGGRYAFKTTDLAIAGLLCAFYPIFPAQVLDNQAHLQALRHFWVFAAEPRCLVPRDASTGEIITLPVAILRKTGQLEKKIAPCLVPEFESISYITTTDGLYWRVELDFDKNAQHLAAFQRHQTIYLRRKSLLGRSPTVFGSELVMRMAASLFPASPDDGVSSEIVNWISSLSSLRGCDVRKAHVLDALGEMTLGAHDSRHHLEYRLSAVDDALMLFARLQRPSKQDLLFVRVLLQWAATRPPSLWLRTEWLDTLLSRITSRV